jgi:hypothetical protein
MSEAKTPGLRLMLDLRAEGRVDERDAETMVDLRAVVLQLVVGDAATTEQVEQLTAIIDMSLHAAYNLGMTRARK